MDLRFGPVEMRRGDDLLSPRREMRQQRVAAGRIEFAENIIQEQQGERRMAGGDEPGLREPQGQRQRPLLSI